MARKYRRGPFTWEASPYDPDAYRCTIVAITDDGQQARRCRIREGHGGRYGDGCQFGDVWEGICRRLSVNFTRGTARTCLLPVMHDDDCVYLDMTERPATRVEMRLPTNCHDVVTNYGRIGRPGDVSAIRL